MYSRCNSYQFHLFSLAVDQTSYRNHEQKKSPTQRTLFDEADTGKTPTLFPVELLNFVQVVRVQFLDRSLCFKQPRQTQQTNIKQWQELDSVD